MMTVTMQKEEEDEGINLMGDRLLAEEQLLCGGSQTYWMWM
jgi:hypothetical protein